MNDSNLHRPIYGGGGSEIPTWPKDSIAGTIIEGHIGGTITTTERERMPPTRGTGSRAIRRSVVRQRIKLESAMGVKAGISLNQWPEQGTFLGKRVKVSFGSDSRSIGGKIVRDDATGVTIIRLDDDRYVLGTECQHTLPR